MMFKRKPEQLRKREAHALIATQLCLDHVKYGTYVSGRDVYNMHGHLASSSKPLPLATFHDGLLRLEYRGALDTGWERLARTLDGNTLPHRKFVRINEYGQTLVKQAVDVVTDSRKGKPDWLTLDPEGDLQPVELPEGFSFHFPLDGLVSLEQAHAMTQGDELTLRRLQRSGG